MERLKIEELSFSIDFALSQGFQFITCSDYVKIKNTLKNEKFIVLRVDVDYDLEASHSILKLLKHNGIKASFFIRLHAESYNVFSKKHSSVIKQIISEGHEIGYHSELIDMGACFGISPSQILSQDMGLFEEFYGSKFNGSASHREPEGKNNLLFWQGKNSTEYDLVYEAYDNSSQFGLFFNSFYISDSEWYNWKNFVNGVQLNTSFNLSEAIQNGYHHIYLLIHPDTYV